METIRTRLEPGDKINARGIIATIDRIMYQDSFIWNKGEPRIYDVEFIDTNGNYRHWKSNEDGGSVILKEQTTDTTDDDTTSTETERKADTMKNSKKFYIYVTTTEGGLIRSIGSYATADVNEVSEIVTRWTEYGYTVSVIQDGKPVNLNTFTTSATDDDIDTETTTRLEEKSPAQEASEGIARYHANEAGRIAVEICQLEKAIRESDDENSIRNLKTELEQAKQELEYHRQAVCKWTERAKTGSTAATDTETDDTETRAEYPAIYEAEGKQIEEGATLYHIDPDNPLDYLSGKVIEIEPALNQAFITIQTPRGNLADYYQTFSFEPPAACGYWRSCLNL